MQQNFKTDMYEDLVSSHNVKYIRPQTLTHPEGKALTSDWCVNYFQKVFCAIFFYFQVQSEFSVQKMTKTFLIDNNSKAIHVTVRSESWPNLRGWNTSYMYTLLSIVDVFSICQKKKNSQIQRLYSFQKWYLFSKLCIWFEVPVQSSFNKFASS